MTAASNNTQSAILDRILRPKKATMTRAAAQALVKMEFAASDLRRMGVLLAATKTETISADEAYELEAYRNVGRMIDIMKSRARQVLNA